MRFWLQNFVSIQPRTSLEKSDVSWAGPTEDAALHGLACPLCLAGVEHEAPPPFAAPVPTAAERAEVYSKLIKRTAHLLADFFPQMCSLLFFEERRSVSPTRSSR